MEPTEAARRVIEAKRHMKHAREMAELYLEAGDRLRSETAYNTAEMWAEVLEKAVDELERSMAAVVALPFVAEAFQ